MYRLGFVRYTNIETGESGRKPMFINEENHGEKYDIYPRYDEDQARENAEYIKQNMVFRQHSQYGWYVFIDPREVEEFL